jgi:SAM-dependent methyltransferase
MEEKKLNAGCGTDVREGWINLDSRALAGVDVVHDLEDLPLPFDDGRFSNILCRDVLEHVDLLPLMEEFHRLLRKGGVLFARVPHFTSANNYADPTHRRFFSVRTFEFFVAGNRLRRDYYFGYAFESIRSCRVTFEKGILLYNHVVQPLLNLSPRILRLWESTCASRVFPAENIEVELVK